MRSGAILVLLSAALALAAPVRADAGVLEEFVRCRPEFFDALKGARADLEPVSVTPRATEEPTGGEATFGRPLGGFGLRFEAYRQKTLVSAARSWDWGFVTAAKARQVAFAIDPYLRKEHISEAGFENEASGYWSASLGAPKSGRWRQLRIFSMKDGRTLLACGAIEGVYEGFGGLPAFADLFGGS